MTRLDHLIGDAKELKECSVRFLASDRDYRQSEIIAAPATGNSQPLWSINRCGIGFDVEGIVRPGQTDPIRLEDWRSWVPMVKGTGNTYKDSGMGWDNKGKNGYYAQFSWP